MATLERRLFGDLDRCQELGDGARGRILARLAAECRSIGGALVVLGLLVELLGFRVGALGLR